LRKAVLLILCLIVFAGCSNVTPTTDTLNFIGETENWRAELIQTVPIPQNPPEKMSSHKFVLQYKGIPTSIGLVKYEYKIHGGSGSGEAHADNNGYVTKGGVAGNIHLLEKEETVTVTVQWDDKKEEIELRYPKSK